MFKLELFLEITNNCIINAKQAGIKGYEKYIDCRELKNYADIQKAVKKYIVFGRVNPEQKRQNN